MFETCPYWMPVGIYPERTPKGQHDGEAMK
jgi:hypothetical protein